MLHPSYTELMKVINGDSEEEKVISSRYSIVLASAKRARQIIAGDMPLVEEKDGAKPLSTAVEELWEEQTGAQRAYSQRREPPVSTPNIAPLPPQCARRRQVAAQAPDRNRRASRTG